MPEIGVNKVILIGRTCPGSAGNGVRPFFVRGLYTKVAKPIDSLGLRRHHLAHADGPK